MRRHGVITLRNTSPVDIILRNPDDLAPAHDYQPDLVDQLVGAGQQAQNSFLPLSTAA